jgi:hypothetical protein
MTVKIKIIIKTVGHISAVATLLGRLYIYYLLSY